jgi:hypothetical protein
MLDGLRLSVYGAHEGAALRDILFTWWEQRFLGAAESGALRSATGPPKATRARVKTQWLVRRGDRFAQAELAWH